MGNDSFPAAKEAFAIQHNNPATAAAADLDISPGADHRPFTGPARMGFSGCDHVSDKDLLNHDEPRFQFIIYHDRWFHKIMIVHGGGKINEVYRTGTI